MLEVRRMSFRNRKCIHTVKSTARGSGSMKTAIRGKKSTIMEFHFLSIILTDNMYFMVIHLKKSGLPWNENRSQEYRRMSTSGEKEICSGVLMDSGNMTMPSKTTIPFDMTGLKSLIDNSREIKWRGLETEGTTTSSPHFLCWKINL